MATVTQQETRTLPVMPTVSEGVVELAIATDPSYVLLSDAGVFTDATADAIDPGADDVKIYPSPVSNYTDFMYIGHTTKFRAVRFDISTAGAGTYAQRWQYWDGSAWKTFLAVVSTSVLKSVLNDDLSVFKSVITGGALAFNVPSDWDTTAIDGNTAYWIRCSTTSGTVTTSPLAQQIWVELTSVHYHDTLTDSLNLADAVIEDADIALSDDSLTISDYLVPTAGQTVADTVTLTDLVVQTAKQTIADTVTMTDLVIKTAATLFTDGVSLTDAVTQSILVALSETINLAEQISLDAAQELADSLGLADAVSVAQIGHVSDTISLADTISIVAAIAISDAVSLSDVLNEGSSFVVGESISLSDALVGIVGHVIADTIELTEGLIRGHSIKIADTISLSSDALSGDLEYGFTVPGEADVSTTTIKGGKPEITNWNKNVSSTPSPITAITRSSDFTIITNTTVLDYNIWDLSEVSIGHIAVSSSDHMGVVKAIGVNTITIDEWELHGVKMGTTASNIPPDGSYVTIHTSLRAKQVLLRAHADNTEPMYLGLGDDSVDAATGHPITSEQNQDNSEIVIKAPGDRWLNLARLWVVSGSDQRLQVITGGISSFGGAASGPSSSLADSLSIADSLTPVFTPGPGVEAISLFDTISVTDDIASADAITSVNDSASLVDDFTVNAYGIALTKADGITLSPELLIANASIAGAPGGSLADSISINDSLSGELNVSADVSRWDTITIGDSLSGAITGGAFPLSVPEYIDAVKVGDFLYVTCRSDTYGHGVVVWDISTPASPTRHEYLALTPAGTARYYIPGKIIEDPAGRDYLFVGTKYPEDGLTSLDIGVAGSPAVSDVIPHGMYPHSYTNYHADICGYDERIYMCAAQVALRMYNTSDPENLVQISTSFDTSYNIYDEHVGGPIGDEWHHDYDATLMTPAWSPPYLKYIHVYSIRGSYLHHRMTCNATYIVIAGADGRVYWLDRSDAPTFNDITPGVKTPNDGSQGNVDNIKIVGNDVHVHYIYYGVTYPDYTYQIIGKGKSAYPSVHSAFTNGYSSDPQYAKMEIVGNYAYILNGVLNVSVLNTTTGTEIYVYTDRCFSFHVSGNYLYLLINELAGDSYIDVYDISVPSVPVLVGTCTW